MASISTDLFSELLTHDTGPLKGIYLMAWTRRSFFNHTDSVGRYGGQNITTTVYIWNACAESIAASKTNINFVVDNWTASTDVASI